MPGIGFQNQQYLDDFGMHVFDVFGHIPYHVGSSLPCSPEYRRDFRDVDVRLILPDEEFIAQFGDPAKYWESRKWVTTILVWTAFGEKLTGLPLDFQIQDQTTANAKYPCPRSALIKSILRRQKDST